MSQPYSASGPVDLGMVTLDASPGWSFFPLQDRLVGRPSSGVGGVQIVRVPRAKAPWPASHELCMAAAIDSSGYTVESPGTDRARYIGETCMAGGESFHGGDDFVRIWYRHCPDGMVAAWFAVKAMRVEERSVMDTIRQCDQMIATIRLPPPVS